MAKIRLLIVDDEKEIREMLSRHFRFLGHEVLTAANGREALETMAETSIEVVISDIKMPELDGIDLLRAVRKEYPMTRVIMVTGYVTQENVLACMRHGAETCVYKPFEDLSELEVAVNEAADRMARWREKMVQLRRMKPAEGGAGA